jgi:Ankyrin repeats (3 copies)
LASDRNQAERFEDFVRVIVSGDGSAAAKLLDASPLLAKERAVRGASRQASKQHFFDRILHYMYEGDTALYIAAAAYQSSIVEKLIANGADVRARNRRGAEPLHYAVDGGPGLPAWNPSAQTKIIARLVGAGADPMHRAVRNRSAAAVKHSSKAAPTRAPPIAAARHQCFSPRKTPAAVGPDQPRRRRSSRRFCAFSGITEPFEGFLFQPSRRA